ncbi:MAG: acetyltransferase [Acidimicrobiia bacterium]|nr:acetyltransferase [Acidimicrobiia bacterium]
MATTHATEVQRVSLRPDAPEGRSARLPYAPGLDGLRALAVAAVLVYHADATWLPAGFLGVEVFFVISGYLITALLLSEWREWGRIDLRQFWLRRARRLLPALFAVVAVVSAVAVIFLPGEVASLRGDAVASLFYVQNWYQIFADQSYFVAAGRPPLLQHLWSLAVEEQFYLVWPLLFVAGMVGLGRRRFLLAILGGIVVSAALMAIWFSAEDPSRVYYGTDTRAAGLLVGVALAFVWSPWRLRADTGPGASSLMSVAGVMALVVLGRQMLGFGEFDPALYRGGFLLVALTTAVVIAAVVHPATALGRAMGWGPLRWVGLRSYGIYLWHWPIFMLTRPGLDVDWGPVPLTVFRVGATLLAAEASYRYLEMPIRRGVIGDAMARLRHSDATQRSVARARAGLVGAGALAVTSVLVIAMVRAEPAEPPEWALVAGTSTSGLLPSTADGTVPPPVADDVVPPPLSDDVVPPPVTDAADDPGASGGEGPAPVEEPAPPPAPAPGGPAPPGPEEVQPVDVGRVMAIGDSVMLGAANALHHKFSAKAWVDAEVSRQVSVGIDRLREWRATYGLGDAVVIHLGNNGTFTDQQFDELVAVLEGVPKVVFVTVRVPRSWEAPVNDVIRNGAARHPHVIVADWRTYSEGRPEWFWDDGHHLRPEGARAYSELIASLLT